MATSFQLEKKNSIAWITVNDGSGRKPCTLDWEVLDQLEKILDDVAKDDAIRAAVLQSANPKSFVVGANINVLQTLNAQNIQHWVRNGHRIFNKMQTMGIPVIAKVEGYALGGGLELAMACDFIVATKNAYFAQPEASLGVMPGWGGSYRLSTLAGRNRAKEMFFTGEKITAQQAYEWGIVNHVCEKEVMDDVLNGILENICKNDAQVLKLVKEIINHHCQDEADKSATEEALTSAVCMNSPTTLQRLKAFFDSRKKK